MNPQREFMSETFHTLAQPIMALRATVELGVLKNASEQDSHLILEDCLRLIDRLMQDMAVLREITSLDEEPPLESCDGQALLRGSVEEMANVAQSSGIALHLDAEPALLRCNAAMFQRAIFVLLDELIAGAVPGSAISISLRRFEDGFLLQLRPGTPQGQRQKLSHKLMQFSGGSGIRSTSGCTSVRFGENSSGNVPAASVEDKQLLTSH